MVVGRADRLLVWLSVWSVSVWSERDPLDLGRVSSRDR